MSDLKKQDPTQENNKNQQPELAETDLSKVTGGWGDIKGGSTDDKHKDWSEVA
jgi:hypothetical protein